MKAATKNGAVRTDRAWNRLHDVEARIRMIGYSLVAVGNSDCQDPDPESLMAMGFLAQELAEELAEIYNAITREDNERYMAELKASGSPKAKRELRILRGYYRSQQQNARQ